MQGCAYFHGFPEWLGLCAMGGIAYRDALTDTAEMVSGCGAGVLAVCYGVILSGLKALALCA